MTQKLTQSERLRLRLLSGVAEETLKRYLRNQRVREASAARIEQAARKLRISLHREGDE